MTMRLLPTFASSSTVRFAHGLERSKVFRTVSLWNSSNAPLDLRRRKGQREGVSDNICFPTCIGNLAQPGRALERVGQNGETDLPFCQYAGNSLGCAAGGASEARSRSKWFRIKFRVPLPEIRQMKCIPKSGEPQPLGIATARQPAGVLMCLEKVGVFIWALTAAGSRCRG